VELDVRSLPQGPSDAVLETDAAELDLVQDPGLAFEGPVGVRLHVVRHGDNLLIQGWSEGSVRGECARCLEATAVPVEAEFTVYAEGRPEGGVRGLDRELEADHYLCFHDGVRLEVGESVREALLLALPIRFLCRPDCRGLCPGCGANLNQEPCTCAERAARAAARSTDS
jgi:uncharacterized protein